LIRAKSAKRSLVLHYHITDVGAIADNLLSIQTPASSTTFTYDALGQLTRIVNPAGRTALAFS
jgi:YD repeat-containing protein